MRADIATTFAALSRLDGSAWDAQCDAYAARLALALAVPSQLTRERREHAPARREPPQLTLPLIRRRRRSGQRCLHCGHDVPPRADSGPLPLYCSERCRRGLDDAAHERRRPPRDRESERRAARERRWRDAPGQLVMAV
jgi:endogenous inhibitor of DNA gyrase (YacG/DUF329 family)